VAHPVDEAGRCTVHAASGPTREVLGRLIAYLDLGIRLSAHKGTGESFLVVIACPRAGAAYC